MTSNTNLTIQDLLNNDSEFDESKVIDAINKGVTTIEEGKSKTPILHIAASTSLYNEVKDLIERGTDVNSIRNPDGNTPLHVVSWTTDLRMIEILLKYGADVNIQNIKGYTPLFHASEMCAADVVELLIKYKANPKLKAKDGSTPLHQISKCFSNKLYDVIELKDQDFFDKQIEENQYCQHIYAWIDKDLRSSCDKTYSMLIQAGADTNAIDQNGHTADYLINRYFDHNSCTKSYETLCNLISELKCSALE